MNSDGWRQVAGDLNLRAPVISEIVVTVGGRLKNGVVERHERGLRAAVSGPFGQRSGLGITVPGGKFLSSPAAPGSPYAVRFENSYLKVWATRSKVSPALLVAFSPYATYAESPERLDSIVEVVSGELLDGGERARRISRVVVALDFRSSWFEPPAEVDVITRAKSVTRVNPPHLASAVFGSISGGTQFGFYDPIMLARAGEKAWPGRTDGENYHDGLRVWRAEFCFHRPAIRKLDLGRRGPAGTRQETISALAGSLDVLLRGALSDGDNRPWVRVAAAGTSGTDYSRRPDAWWWVALREAFLAGASSWPGAMANRRGATTSPGTGGWRKLLRGATAIRA